MTEEEEEEDDVAVRIGGVDINGRVRDILGNIAGRDVNYILNVGPEDAERLMKALMAKVREAPARLEAAWKNTDKATPWDLPSPSFWINEVLDRLHSAMKAINAIYFATFTDVETKLDANEPTSLNDAIALLSARNVDSRGTREDFYALRKSVRKLSGTPQEIENYLGACERYFFEATTIAVGTPMRTLLNELKDINKKAMSETQLQAAASENGIHDFRKEAQESVTLVLARIERRWPDVLSNYYDGRLGILHRAERRNEVEALLKRRELLTSDLAFFRGRASSERNEWVTEVQEIDASLAKLTG